MPKIISLLLSQTPEKRVFIGRGLLDRASEPGAPAARVVSDFCSAFAFAMSEDTETLLCDTDLLKKRSEACRLDDITEVIRLCLCFDPLLFSELYGTPEDSFVLSRLLTGIGRMHDGNLTALLSFALPLQRVLLLIAPEELTEAQAKAVSMMMTVRAAVSSGFCHEQFSERLRALLNYFALPTDFLCTEKEVSDAFVALYGEQSLPLSLPRRIGECALYDLYPPQAGSFFRLPKEII